MSLLISQPISPVTEPPYCYHIDLFFDSKVYYVTNYSKVLLGIINCEKSSDQCSHEQPGPHVTGTTSLGNADNHPGTVKATRDRITTGRTTGTTRDIARTGPPTLARCPVTGLACRAHLITVSRGVTMDVLHMNYQTASHAPSIYHNWPVK